MRQKFILRGRPAAKNGQTRRQFLATAGTLLCVTAQGRAGTGVLGQLSRDGGSEAYPPEVQRVKLGLASYTFRKFKLEQVLSMAQRVGLKYICLKSNHLPLESTPEQITTAVAKVKQAGLELYGGGVIYTKTKAEVEQAFEYARAAGMKVIVGAPGPELLELVETKVKQYDIKVAIHNHGPEDKIYPTPASAYEKIKNLDSRIGLCIDIAHTQRCGIDPAQAAEMFADRLLDVHLNDVSAPVKDAKYLELGRGIIDVPKLFRTLLKIKFTGVAAFEYVKDADDPLPGLAESVGFARGVLAAI